MTFGEKLKQLRIDKGLTQEQASKEIGIAVSSLRNYENERLPDTYQLKQIRDFYNVPYEYLLDDNSNNKNYENLGIGNKLNLSDKTIEKIVEINTKVNSEIIGKFIDYMSINEFWNKINEYIKLTNEINLLLPTLEILKYKALFTKYSTQDDLFNYLIRENEDSGYADTNAFYITNSCQYRKDDKKQLLDLLNLFLKIDDEPFIISTSLKTDEVIYSDFDLSNALFVIKNCINNNAKMPILEINTLFEFPNKQINKKKERQEIIGFYLSKELNKFLSYLDNEEAE